MAEQKRLWSVVSPTAHWFWMGGGTLRESQLPHTNSHPSASGQPALPLQHWYQGMSCPYFTSSAPHPLCSKSCWRTFQTPCTLLTEKHLQHALGFLLKQFWQKTGNLTLITWLKLKMWCFGIIPTSSPLRVKTIQVAHWLQYPTYHLS